MDAPNNCPRWKGVRAEEDAELSRMSEAERKEIEQELLPMKLLDAICRFLDGPKRRMLEKLVSNGEDLICDLNSLLQEIEDGCCSTTQKLLGSEKRVKNMKVKDILVHEDRNVRKIANYLAATSS